MTVGELKKHIKDTDDSVVVSVGYTYINNDGDLCSSDEVSGTAVVEFDDGITRLIFLKAHPKDEA